MNAKEILGKKKKKKKKEKMNIEKENLKFRTSLFDVIDPILKTFVRKVIRYWMSIYFTLKKSRSRRGILL